MLVLHLKSGPRGYPERKKQWAALDTILTGLLETAQHDADIIVLGDFNNVSDDRTREFLPLLERLGYHWTGTEDTLLITEYWQPDWQQPELKGSGIDQIVVSDDAKIEYMENSLRVGGICSKRAPGFSGEFPKYYRTISDHCPVIVTFRAFPDDD